jgi:hypothetical protein
MHLEQEALDPVSRLGRSTFLQRDIFRLNYRGHAAFLPEHRERALLIAGSSLKLLA